MTWAAALHDVALLTVCVLGCLFSFHMGLSVKVDNLVGRVDKFEDFDEPIIPVRERSEMIVVDSDE